MNGYLVVMEGLMKIGGADYHHVEVVLLPLLIAFNWFFIAELLQQTTSRLRETVKHQTQQPEYNQIYCFIILLELEDVGGIVG